jgi:integrase
VIVPLIKGRQPAFVDFDEEREVLRRAEPLPAHAVIKLAFCLLALTALRPGEIRRAARHEFVCLNGSEPLRRIPGRVTLVDCAHPTGLSCCTSTL